MTSPSDPAGVLGIPSDKLVPPMNAPGGGAVSPGIQPGTTGQIVLAQYVVVFGTTGGVFIYAGTPALGNPPIYSVSNADFDPYGNVVLPGIWAGQFGSTQIGMQETAGAAQLFLATASSVYADASLSAFASGGGTVIEILGSSNSANPGATSDRAVIAFYDNLSGGGSARIQMGYFTSTGGFIQFLSANYTGLTLALVNSLTAVEPGTGTSITNPAAVENWHAMTLQNGWTQVAGGAPAEYRMIASPPNSVQIRGEVNGSAATSGTITTLPAGYRPAYTVAPLPFQPTSATPSGQYYAQCTTSGLLQMVGGSMAANFNMNGIIPLDS